MFFANFVFYLFVAFWLLDLLFPLPTLLAHPPFFGWRHILSALFRGTWEWAGLNWGRVLVIFLLFGLLLLHWRFHWWSFGSGASLLRLALLVLVHLVDLASLLVAELEEFIEQKLAFFRSLCLTHLLRQQNSLVLHEFIKLGQTLIKRRRSLTLLWNLWQLEGEAIIAITHVREHNLGGRPSAWGDRRWCPSFAWTVESLWMHIETC